MATQWKRDNSTTFTIRISNDTGLPDRIRKEADNRATSVSQLFIQAITNELNGLTSGLTSGLTTTSKDGLTNSQADGLTKQEGGLTTNASMLAPDPTPAVPTYTPTDPLDIIAEAFFHKPYAVLTLDSKNMCDFIADHPITGPDMVLSFPDEWIKAGIEYMNNPTPVPVYQPKPMENAEPISENLKRIRAYRAAKDEAFRQSLAELESLYPEDSDDMFYADSDENVPEEVSDYSEENSEEL